MKFRFFLVLTLIILTYLPLAWPGPEVDLSTQECSLISEFSTFMGLFSQCDPNKENYCKCLEDKSEGKENILLEAVKKESEENYNKLLDNYKQTQTHRWISMYSEMTVGVAYQKAMLDIVNDEDYFCHPKEIAKSFRENVVGGDDEKIEKSIEFANNYSQLQVMREFYSHKKKDPSKILKIDHALKSMNQIQSGTLSKEMQEQEMKNASGLIYEFKSHWVENDAEAVELKKINEYSSKSSKCQELDEAFNMTNDEICEEIQKAGTSAIQKNWIKSSYKAPNQCFRYEDFLVYKGMPSDSLLQALEDSTFNLNDVQENRDLEKQRLAFLKANPILTQLIDNPKIRKEYINGLKKITRSNEKSEREKLRDYLSFMKNDISNILKSDQGLVTAAQNCQDMGNSLIAISKADDIPSGFNENMSQEPKRVSDINDLKSNMLMCQQKGASTNLDATLNVITAFTTTPKTLEESDREDRRKIEDYEKFLNEQCAGYDSFMVKCSQSPKICHDNFLKTKKDIISTDGTIASPKNPKEFIESVQNQFKSNPQSEALRKEILSKLPKSDKPQIAKRGKEKEFLEDRQDLEEKISKTKINRRSSIGNNQIAQNTSDLQKSFVNKTTGLNQTRPIQSNENAHQNNKTNQVSKIKTQSSNEIDKKNNLTAKDVAPTYSQNQRKEPKNSFSQNIPSFKDETNKTISSAGGEKTISINQSPAPKVAPSMMPLTSGSALAAKSVVPHEKPKSPKENSRNTALVKMYEKSEVKLNPEKPKVSDFDGVQVSNFDFVIKDDASYEKIISDQEELENFIKKQFLNKSIPSSSIITILHPKTGVPVVYQVNLIEEGRFEIRPMPEEVKVVRHSTLKHLQNDLQLMVPPKLSP